MSSDAEIFSAPWYPWYVNDVLTSERVELMSLAEEGAYRRALDRAWKKGSIPADPVRCAKAIGKRCTAKIAEAVLRMFDPVPGDPTRMVNTTLEKVREEQKEKYLRRSAKAKDAADKRWHGDAPSMPQAMPEQCHSESDTEREEEKKRKKEETPQAASPKKGTRLPEPFFLTKDMIEWATLKRPGIDLTEETEKFVNYWRAKTGRDACKLDWLATWQNWIYNARTNGTGKGNYQKRTDADVIAESTDFYKNYPA